MSSVERHFRPGQFLFREGDPSKSMFLIKKGSVSIRKMKGSAFVEIAKVYSNEVLGELSFFDRLPRSASALALMEVEVLEIEFSSLDKIYERVPEYMKTIISSVATRLRKANDTIRRLQKDTIGSANELPTEGGPLPEELDAATVLAATADPVREVDLGIDLDETTAEEESGDTNSGSPTDTDTDTESDPK